MKTLGWIVTWAAAGMAVLALLAGLLSSLAGVKATFDREVAELLAAEPAGVRKELLTEAELAALPGPVRRFLEASGYAKIPPIGFVHARYQAQMNLGGLWLPIDCEQYNSVAQSTRLWSGTIKLLPFLWIEGRHLYQNGVAHMWIRLGPFDLVNIRSADLANADMITFFNDLAFFAPNALVHPGVTWKDEGPRAVTAVFRHAGFTNEARLTFDEDGMLINFLTDTRGKLEGDRLVSARWATPITGWQVRDGLRVAVEGSALYYEPAGTAPYIRFGDPRMVLEYRPGQDPSSKIK